VTKTAAQSQGKLALKRSKGGPERERSLFRPVESNTDRWGKQRPVDERDDVEGQKT